MRVNFIKNKFKWNWIAIRALGCHSIPRSHSHNLWTREDKLVAKSPWTSKARLQNNKIEQILHPNLKPANPSPATKDPKPQKCALPPPDPTHCRTQRIRRTKSSSKPKSQRPQKTPKPRSPSKIWPQFLAPPNFKPKKIVAVDSNNSKTAKDRAILRTGVTHILAPGLLPMSQRTKFASACTCSTRTICLNVSAMKLPQLLLKKTLCLLRNQEKSKRPFWRNSRRSEEEKRRWNATSKLRKLNASRTLWMH